LPAIGLHTTVVTARTSMEGEEVPVTVGEEGAVSVGEGASGGVVVPRRSKRFLSWRGEMVITLMGQGVGASMMTVCRMVCPKDWQRPGLVNCWVGN